ncbi:MAG: hypothetical protein ABSC00_00570 [Acidimicrobiales bacterium]|jgi:hypothetical protein
MPRHRKPRHGNDMDERLSLYPHDPDDVMRRLLGVEGTPQPVESHEEAEDADQENEAPES